MQIRFICLLIAFIFTGKIGFTQTITIDGSIKDRQSNAVASATLQLKDAKDLNIIAYGLSKNDGTYILTTTRQSRRLYLIVSCLGFKRDTLILESGTVNLLKYNFVLQTDENQLNEVAIRMPKPIIEVVNDTTKYNVAAFTTPDDRSLEDVIKKLPGMEVSKDGTIYFKQKQISKVLLEGDDLSGSNYKAITQNLKPQLVDEVQAVEHWVEDDLLKGIISSDDIVLNLTLKDKRKQKLIGSADAGYGTNDRKDLSANLIGFVKQTKSYSFIQYNNTGTSQENLFRLAGANKNLIGDGKLINHFISPYTPFDGNALALNSSLSGSLNSITRFSPNFKLSTRFYALSSKLYSENAASSIYYEPINVSTVNQQNQQSNNKLYQGDLTTDYLVNRNSRLTSQFSYKYRPQEFDGLALSGYNNIQKDQIKQFQKDRLNNYNLELKYTIKANSSSAIVISARAAKDRIDQNYSTASALYTTVPSFGGADSLLQKVNNNYETFNVDLQALKKYKHHYFYGNLGVESNHSTLNTALFNDNTGNSIAGFYNLAAFDNHKAYMVGKYTFNGETLNFRAYVKVSIINQQQLEADSTFFTIEPQLDLKIKLTDFQSLSLKYNYKNTLANPADYYAEPILTDIRSVNTGLSKIYNYGDHNFGLTYSNVELQDKYLTFNLGGNAQFVNGGLLLNNFFQNTFYYSQKETNGESRNFSANAGFQKFLPLIASKLDVAFIPSLSSYNSKINGLINKYTSTTNAWNIKLATGFRLPVNFGFEVQYQNTVTRLKKESINDLSSYKFGITSRYQLSKTISNLVDFGRYKIGGSTYNLLNAQLQFVPAKGNFSFAIYGKNLTDVKAITNSYVSNVAESKSSSTILGRYVLASVSMSIK